MVTCINDYIFTKKFIKCMILMYEIACYHQAKVSFHIRILFLLTCQGHLKKMLKKSLTRQIAQHLPEFSLMRLMQLVQREMIIYKEEWKNGL